MAPVPDALPLVDAQGRRITYLRLSLTDRCNFRCGYCSASNPEASEHLLSREEVRRVVAVFARAGVRRVRLTGGEPTLRKDVVGIAADIAATPGIEEVAITTNGHRLAELARPLREAGVGAVNVSLDTLDPARLGAISGKGASLDAVLEGIEAAGCATFRSVETNTVVIGGRNEDELASIVSFAWGAGATPRFIELMPFGDGAPVPTHRVKALLAEQGLRLEHDPHRGWGPAHYLREVGGVRRVGFIGAMTENFCASCNRARITASGDFQACLGGSSRVALRELLREGASDGAVLSRIRDALAAKAPRHHMADGGALVLLPMRGIGG